MSVPGPGYSLSMQKQQPLITSRDSRAQRGIASSSERVNLSFMSKSVKGKMCRCIICFKCFKHSC